MCATTGDVIAIKTRLTIGFGDAQCGTLPTNISEVLGIKINVNKLPAFSHVATTPEIA
jgi:hypothetical protein